MDVGREIGLAERESNGRRPQEWSAAVGTSTGVKSSFAEATCTTGDVSGGA
jgi:hypothetical protein